MTSYGVSILTVLVSAAKAEKAGKIVKTSLSGADVIIGPSQTLEDYSCNDPICGTIDIIGSVLSVMLYDITLRFGRVQRRRDMV